MALAIPDSGPFRRIKKAPPAITAYKTLEYLLKSMAISFFAGGQEPT
jgi:hypothetical protein